APEFRKRNFERLVGPNMKNLAKRLEDLGFKNINSREPDYNGKTSLFADTPLGTNNLEFIVDVNSNTAPDGQIRILNAKNELMGKPYTSFDEMMKDVEAWYG